MNREKKLFLSLIIFFFSSISCPVFSHAFCFEEAGRAHNISVDLLESIARVESSFNSKALHVNRNGTTDMGLMQINSAWIDPLGINKENLIADPCYNVMIGASILRQCIDAHGYTWEAVGCYNAKSKGKRVGYSWKIFRELKKEKLRKVARKKESMPENASSDQSLYFRVREAETTALSENP